MREVLDKYGFKFNGFCLECAGNAEKFIKNGIEVKIIPAKMRFKIYLNNNVIIGKSGDLENTLIKYNLA